MPERSRNSKNPHAVALGRRGGLVGGRVRARRLSAEQRSASAATAARARWGTPRRKPTAPSPVRERILTAARRAFLSRGVDAAQVGRIARAAGVNKRMIYYYFGSKDGLFRELLRRSAVAMMVIGVEVGDASLEEQLSAWDDALRARPAWIRLSIWEALSGASQWVAANERRDFWRNAIGDVVRLQRDGLLPVTDAAQMQLTLIAIAMFPYVLPQFAELVTGMKVDGPEFRESRARFFAQLAAAWR